MKTLLIISVWCDGHRFGWFCVMFYMLGIVIALSCELLSLMLSETKEKGPNTFPPMDVYYFHLCHFPLWL